MEQIILPWHAVPQDLWTQVLGFGMPAVRNRLFICCCCYCCYCCYYYLLLLLLLLLLFIIIITAHYMLCVYFQKTAALRQQNADLKGILNQYLSNKINYELISAPSHIIGLANQVAPDAVPAELQKNDY
jgi:ABC-type siderophore export system fused ATPase/permease subunit